MIKRTSPFSLIEVIIATSLFSILLFTTTSLFFRYHKLNAHLQTVRPKVLERTLFYQKMLDMSGTIETSSIKTENPYYEDFLSFIFDNGFKDNARLSGRCLCSVYRAPGGVIKYEVSNESKDTSTRVLMQDVTSLKSYVKKDRLYMEIGVRKGASLYYCFPLPQEQGKK